MLKRIYNKIKNMIVKKGNQSDVNPANGMSASGDVSVNEDRSGFADKPNDNAAQSSVGMTEFSLSSSKGRYFNPITNEVVDIVEMDLGGSIDQYGKKIGASWKASNGKVFKSKEFSEFIKVENNFVAPPVQKEQPKREDWDVDSLEELEDILNDSAVVYSTSMNDTVADDLNRSAKIEPVKSEVRPNVNQYIMAQNSVHRPNTDIDELEDYLDGLVKYKKLLFGTTSYSKSKKSKTAEGDVKEVNQMLDVVINDFAEKLIKEEDGKILIIDIRKEKYKHLIEKAKSLHSEFDDVSILNALKKKIQKLF